VVTSFRLPPGAKLKNYRLNPEECPFRMFRRSKQGLFGCTKTPKMFPNFRQGIAFLRFPSIARLSFGRSNIYPYMKTSMEQWLNDTDRGKPKCSEKNLSKCCRVNHKSSGIEPSATLPAQFEIFGFIGLPFHWNLKQGPANSTPTLWIMSRWFHFKFLGFLL